jgi:hypothetical protein
MPASLRATRSCLGNGVAVLILILLGRKDQKRNPASDCLILRCSHKGNSSSSSANSLPFISIPLFRSHYRRANLILRRADVTQKRNKPVENRCKSFILLDMRIAKEAKAETDAELVGRRSRSGEALRGLLFRPLRGPVGRLANRQRTGYIERKRGGQAEREPTAPGHAPGVLCHA